MNYIGYKTKAFEVIKEAPIEYQKGSHKKYIVQCLKCGTTFIRTIQNINKFQGTGCLTCTPRYSKIVKITIDIYICIIKITPILRIEFLI